MYSDSARVWKVVFREPGEEAADEVLVSANEGLGLMPSFRVERDSTRPEDLTAYSLTISLFLK